MLSDTLVIPLFVIFDL